MLVPCLLLSRLHDITDRSLVDLPISSCGRRNERHYWNCNVDASKSKFFHVAITKTASNGRRQGFQIARGRPTRVRKRGGGGLELAKIGALVVTCTDVEHGE